MEKEKVTLTLPVDLMAAVRAMVPARRQSQFIAEAIRAYVAEEQRKTLRERLIAGYQANVSSDIELATDWAPADDEAWLKYVTPYGGEEAAHDTTNPAR